MTKHVLLVFANPVEGKEDEFNAFYDAVHLPEMLAVPGVSAAQRFRVRPGEAAQDSGHRYLTVYELDADPDETMRALYEANTSGKIQPFEALDPDSRPVVFEIVGERRTG